MTSYYLNENIFYRDMSMLGRIVMGKVVHIGSDHPHAQAELEDYYVIEVTAGMGGAFHHYKYYADQMMPHTPENEKAYNIQTQLYNIDKEIAALQDKADKLRRAQ